jgi:hypothetical protein|nr:MAG TPA: Protein of unknown function (DUF1003) [Caudoviricetes sp.]
MEMPRILTNVKLFIVICVTITSVIAFVPYPYNILVVFISMLCIAIVANVAYGVGIFVGSMITSQLISQMLQSEIDKQKQLEEEMVKDHT